MILNYISNTSIEDKAEAGIKTSTINDDSAVFSFLLYSISQKFLNSKICNVF